MGGLNGLLGGLVSWVQAQPGVALLSLLLVNGLTLVVAIIALSRGQALSRRQARMLRGVDGGSLESLLINNATNATAVQRELERALATGEANQNALTQTLRRVGFHRYDALANVGGQQSFSVALLDEEANGIVLSGLYTRQDMRVYAKPVKNGRSEIALTPEEQRAIAQARPPRELE